MVNQLPTLQCSRCQKMKQDVYWSATFKKMLCLDCLDTMEREFLRSKWVW